MVRSLVRRERRSLWGTLAVLLVLGVAASLAMVRAGRTRLTEQAAERAMLTAQRSLAPMLMLRDAKAPVDTTRAAVLSSLIDRAITSQGPIDAVTVWSSSGRVHFSADPSRIGARDPAMSDLLFQVSTTEPTWRVVDGTLQTFVGLSLQPGTAAIVAELDQPAAPVVAPASAPWTSVIVALAVAFGLCLLLVAFSSRSAAAAPRPATRRGRRERARRHPKAPEPETVAQEPAAPVPLLASVRPQREARATVAAPSAPPVYQHEGFREIEQARQAAERRATSAEAALRDVQAKLRHAELQLHELETRGEERDRRQQHGDEEFRTLRGQAKDATERAAILERDLARAQAELADLRASIVTDRAAAGRSARDGSVVVDAATATPKVIIGSTDERDEVRPGAHGRGDR